MRVYINDSKPDQCRWWGNVPSLVCTLFVHGLDLYTSSDDDDDDDDVRWFNVHLKAD